MSNDDRSHEDGSDTHDGHHNAEDDDHDHHNAESDDHDHHNAESDDYDHHNAEDDDHDHHHHDIEELGIAVLTVSSSRSTEDDPSGDAIVETVEAAGHTVVVRELVNDEYDSVQGAVDRFANREDTHCVVTTGGTGVTPDDVTIEAIDPLFDKRLPGFGELFRRLSYEEIGTRVVGTRATAGVADGVPVFCLPGSTNAVRLGTREIVVEEAPHLAGLAHSNEGD